MLQNVLKGFQHLYFKGSLKKKGSGSLKTNCSLSRDVGTSRQHVLTGSFVLLLFLFVLSFDGVFTTLI